MAVQRIAIYTSDSVTLFVTGGLEQIRWQRFEEECGSREPGAAVQMACLNNLE